MDCNLIVLKKLLKNIDKDTKLARQKQLTTFLRWEEKSYVWVNLDQVQKEIAMIDLVDTPHV